MRISDLLWMAIKNLKGKLIALIIVEIAISTFCLCFAGAVLVTVQQEKSLPYELEVVSDTAKISDSALAEISRIPDVMAVTPVLQVPVSAKIGGYKAQLTFTGIEASYINETFAQGGAFPENSVMPYIVLNKAACKLFKDEISDGYGTESEEPVIDWLNAVVSVQTNEGAKPVVSKIVGLLSGDDEDQKPVAYISVASAKNLLQDGQSADYMSAKVRVENVGYAADVSIELKKRGLNVLNANEDDELKWDTEHKESTHLVLLGVSCVFTALIFSIYQMKRLRFEQKDVLAALQWIGLKEKDARRISIIQSTVIGLLGVAIGIIVSVFVPSFISSETEETTIFFLQIPFYIIAICAVICIIAYVVPVQIWRIKLKDLNSPRLNG